MSSITLKDYLHVYCQIILAMENHTITLIQENMKTNDRLVAVLTDEDGEANPPVLALR